MERIGEDSDQLAESLLTVVTDCWKAQAIGTFAELGIADHLGAEQLDSASLAARTGCDPKSLHRFLSACVTLGLVHESSVGHFRITETGRLLGSNCPSSIRHWVLWWTRELWPVYGELSYSVRTGKSARQKLYGTTGFDHLKQNPEKAALFHRGLGELTRTSANDIVRAFDFSRFSTVIDVGGGSGELLAAILKANPRSTGILFDLPSALDQLPAHLGDPLLAGRVQFIPGDFFQAIPRGADVVILKSVIHDWSREDALRILASCRQGIQTGAKLLLIERLAPSKVADDEISRIMSQRDLTMLVAHGAQERTEQEYRELLTESAFVMESVSTTPSGFAIMEAT